jgi:hypothetical protein
MRGGSGDAGPAENLGSVSAVQPDWASFGPSGEPVAPRPRRSIGDWWKSRTKKARIGIGIAVAAVVMFGGVGIAKAASGGHPVNCRVEACSYDDSIKYEEHCQAAIGDYHHVVPSECRNGPYDPAWDKTEG